LRWTDWFLAKFQESDCSRFSFLVKDMFTWIVLYAGEGVSLLILLENLHLSCFSIIQSVCTEASSPVVIGLFIFVFWIQDLACMFVILVVLYLSIELAGYSVSPEISRVARKLTWTSRVI
jgi:hypothetical protein